MRLTERPRSLAEMKPDVEWPAELQSVMDRALARDAPARYESAAAFGHDFATAIGRMPRTIAARAGTHIIDTPVVRQTAVGAAPAVITEAGTARTGALARRGSRAPLIIGGATVAVGAIIALGLMESHRGGPRVAADSTALGAGAPSEPSGSDHAAATTAAPVSRGPALPNGGGGAASRLAGGATTERPLGSARGAESRSTAAAGAAALSPAAARAEIDSIRTLALGDRTAAEAVRRADVILPRLLAGNDSAEALLYQSDAYLTLGDSSRTCDALKKIGKRGNSIVRQSVVSGLSHC